MCNAPVLEGFRLPAVSSCPSLEGGASCFSSEDAVSSCGDSIGDGSSCSIDMSVSSEAFSFNDLLSMLYSAMYL